MPITGRPAERCRRRPRSTSARSDAGTRRDRGGRATPSCAARWPSQVAVSHRRHMSPFHWVCSRTIFATIPRRSSISAHRLLELVHREAMGDDRVELEHAVGDQPDDARPGRGGVGDAADQRHVLADEQVGRQRQRPALAGDPEQYCPAAGPAQLGGQRDRDGSPGGLDDEVELGRRRDRRRPRGRPRSRRAAARARAPPRARRRRRSATASAAAAARSRARRASPRRSPPTDLARLRPRLLEAVQHDRRRLDQHAGVERDVVGQAVHDPLGNRDELGVAARSVNPSASMRSHHCVSPRRHGPQRWQTIMPFAHHAVAGAHGRHVGSDLDDRPRPLVAGDHREAHPARVGEDGRSSSRCRSGTAPPRGCGRARRRPPRRAPPPPGRRPGWGASTTTAFIAETILRAVSAIREILRAASPRSTRAR